MSPVKDDLKDRGQRRHHRANPLDQPGDNRGKVKPIVEGIGNGLSWVAGKVKGLLGMGGGDGGSVGSNAEGTNNWRGEQRESPTEPWW